MRQHRTLRTALLAPVAAAAFTVSCGANETPPTSDITAITQELPPPVITPQPAEVSIIDKIQLIPGGSQNPNERIFKILDISGGDDRSVALTDITGQVLDTRREGDEIPIECISPNKGTSSTGSVQLRNPKAEGGYDVIGPAVAWLSFGALLEAQNQGVATCPPGVGTLTTMQSG